MPYDIMTDEIDIGMLREMLATKSTQTVNVKIKLEEAEQQAQSKMKKTLIWAGREWDAAAGKERAWITSIHPCIK